MSTLVRLAPHHYAHILDNNLLTTRVEVGPATFYPKENEELVCGPEKMITIPPQHFCLIENPVKCDESGAVVVDKHGEAKLAHGAKEVRLAQEPFPLYPGEVLDGPVQPLRVVLKDTGLKLKALCDFEDRVAGEEWLFKGPATYIPRVEVRVETVIQSVVNLPNSALRLVALRDFDGRKTGEEWLVHDVGSYLPGVEEKLVSVETATVITDKTAVHMRASRTFNDPRASSGVVERLAGSEWLVTLADGVDTVIPDVYEEIVAVVPVTSLSPSEYCVVLNPVNPATGKQRLGHKELRRGAISSESTFFLMPGEELENGIESTVILAEDEALLLSANESFHDDSLRQRSGSQSSSGAVLVEEEAGVSSSGGARKAGDRWMVFGPMEYIPPVEVTVVEKRQVIPLDENEGIYVRDKQTGDVRAIVGQSTMLQPNEELWEKDLQPVVERLVAPERNAMTDRFAPGHNSPGSAPAVAPATRDRTRVVSYRTPHNSAVQVYNYKTRQARVCFGPELVMLEPEEQFTVLSLSGSTPKKPNQIHALALLLGPDFMTDIIVVETSDHARLKLQLSYNWHFDIDKQSSGDASKLSKFPILSATPAKRSPLACAVRWRRSLSTNFTSPVRA